MNTDILSAGIETMHHHLMVQTHKYESEAYDFMTADWTNGMFISGIAIVALVYAFGMWGAWESVKFIARSYNW